MSYIVSFDLFLGVNQTSETKQLYGGKSWSASYMTHWWKTNRDSRYNGVPIGGNLVGTAYRAFLKENNLEDKIKNQLIQIYQWLKDNPENDPAPAYQMADEIKTWIRAGKISNELIQEMNNFFANSFVKFLAQKVRQFEVDTDSLICIDNFESQCIKYVQQVFCCTKTESNAFSFSFVRRISGDNQKLYEYLMPLVTDFAIMLRSSFSELEDKDNDAENTGDSMGAGLFDSLPAQIHNWQQVLLDFFAEVFDGPRAISSTFRYWLKNGSTPLLNGDMPSCMMVKDRTEKGYSAVVYVSQTGVALVTINTGFDSVVKGDDDNVVNYKVSTSLLQDGKINASAIRSRDSNRVLSCFATMEDQIKEVLELALITYEQSVDCAYSADTEFGNTRPGNLFKMSQYQIRRWDQGGIPDSINAFKLLSQPKTTSVAVGFTNAPIIAYGQIYVVNSADELPRNMSGKIILAPNAGTEFRKIVLSWGTEFAPEGFLSRRGSITAHVPAVLAGVMLCGVSVKSDKLNHGDYVTAVCDGGQVKVYKEEIPFESYKIGFSEIPKTKIKTGLVLTNYGWCDKDAYLPDVAKISLARWEMGESGLVIDGYPILPMPCYLYYDLMPENIKRIIDIQRCGQNPVDFYNTVMTEVFSGVLNSNKNRKVNLRGPDWREPTEARFYLPDSIYKSPDNSDCSLSGSRLITRGGELGDKILGVCGDIFSELKHRGFTNFAPMLPNVCFADMDAIPILKYLDSRGISPQEFDYVCMDEVPILSAMDIDGNAVEYQKLADAGIVEISNGNNDEFTGLLKIARDQTPDYHLYLVTHPSLRRRYSQKVKNAHKYGMKIGSCGNAHPVLMKLFQEVGFDSVGLPPGIAYYEVKKQLAENEKITVAL